MKAYAIVLSPESGFKRLDDTFLAADDSGTLAVYSSALDLDIYLRKPEHEDIRQRIASGRYRVVEIDVQLALHANAAKHVLDTAIAYAEGADSPSPGRIDDLQHDLRRAVDIYRRATR